MRRMIDMPPRGARPTTSEIMESVCDVYSLNITDLHSQDRHRRLARPRQVAMYLARKMTPRSSTEIGRYIGGRDHSTVLHAVAQIERLVPDDPDLELAIKWAAHLAKRRAAQRAKEFSYGR